MQKLLFILMFIPYLSHLNIRILARCNASNEQEHCKLQFDFEFSFFENDKRIP